MYTWAVVGSYVVVAVVVGVVVAVVVGVVVVGVVGVVVKLIKVQSPPFRVLIGWLGSFFYHLVKKNQFSQRRRKKTRLINYSFTAWSNFPIL